MTNPNDPAFLPWSGSDGKILSALTKREYFAIEFCKELYGALYMQPDFLKHWKIEGVAINAISMADALIAALNKTETEKRA